MKWSISLGKIAGIKLFVHWTFLILIGWILLLHFQVGHTFKEGAIGVSFVLSIFICVILHELGHALTAKKYNIVTKSIIILPIGGVANMERMPEKPGQELRVAIMGPMVNVTIALLLFIFLSLTGGMISLEEWVSVQEEKIMVISGSDFLFNLMIVNIVLVLFNLIPAFPMDGGRVLRAVLSYRLSRLEATKIAASLGQVLAIFMVFAGFYANFLLVFIGFFIFLGAGGEASFEVTKSILKDYQVKDVRMSQYTILSPQVTLGEASKKLLEGLEQEFLVGDKDAIMGILTRKNIIKGLSEFGKDAPISSFIRKDFLVLQPEMKLKEVFPRMIQNASSIAPVYDELRLIGIVEQENINELIMVNRALNN